MIRMIRASLLISAAASIIYAGNLLAAETTAPLNPGRAAADRATLPDSQRKPLDLRPPDATKIYTPEQIERVLSEAFDRNIAEVEVEGERERRPLEPVTPRVWPTIAAPFWALLHPLQAWRIIAPMPPDQTRSMPNEPFDATLGRLEPAAADARSL